MCTCIYMKPFCIYHFSEVKNFASDLLSRWMTIFKEGQAGTLHTYMYIILLYIILIYSHLSCHMYMYMYNVSIIP